MVMDIIEDLNNQYTEVMKDIETLRLYDDKVSAEQLNSESLILKVTKTYACLQSLSEEIDCTRYVQIKDTQIAIKQYLICLDAINEYKSALIQFSKSGQDAVLKSVHKLTLAQKKYDELKVEYRQKYNYILDSEDALNKSIVICVGNSLDHAQKHAEQLKIEAKEILGKEYTIELRLSDNIKQTDFLPENLLAARHQFKKISMPILNDIGVTNTFQNIYIDLKSQGNVIISTDYEQMGDEAVDGFILAYIFRYIEAFPLGTVNVHIFDQNTNYLYKRLCNSFQSENAGESTRKTVQIHTDMRDLLTFRDVNCEDIFRKTSVDTPDLYSVYEHDKTDPFNLIILRDGFVDGTGYALTEILDAISSLSKPGDIGHKCGLRFLIIDSSGSFEKNLASNAKYLISQIQQNCSLKLRYSDGQFVLDDKVVEALHIVDDPDVFVQERSQYLAETINNKEQHYVSIDEISAGTTAGELGCIMYIPVGKAGNSVVELPFSCKDENGTVAGQCTGYMAIGQTGSGKSSFFHSLILNGCMRYSPNDLQFWLLDFKNGGASSKYSDSGLPHIRIIAEDNKIDDALCLFQMILEEMERRSKAFNKNFADNIVDYNRVAIEKNLEYFPRIIIAIDEVQEIFREDNASVLQKLISSISTRMRSAGMHFVMVAQNLSEGKSYMLKDAFLPSATGRICFRVAPDIPRDSGFDEDFIQRRTEIAELKTGEAYVGYGKDTLKKVKIAYTSPQEMSGKYFVDIRNKYPEYPDRKPLVIGSKQRLTINSSLQGMQRTYIDELRDVKTYNGVCTAVIGEDAYRMSPLRIRFSQHENSSVLFLGSDKQISSSLCTSIAISLLKQNVKVHLFNGDRTKVQEEFESVSHSFMYICQNINVSSVLMQNHRLTEIKDVMKDIYSEYLKRETLVQKADDEESEFAPIFLIINDLFGIESFNSNEMVESEMTDTYVESPTNSVFGFNYDILSSQPSQPLGNNRGNGQFRENLQNIMSILVKNGWRYNIHMILAIKGDPSTWGYSRIVSEANNVVLFNTTEYADKFENSYYLKEMLKNISNDSEAETMAVWVRRKTFSKIRPVIYKMSEPLEKTAVESLIKGE